MICYYYTQRWWRKKRWEMLRCWWLKKYFVFMLNMFSLRPTVLAFNISTIYCWLNVMALDPMSLLCYCCYYCCCWAGVEMCTFFATFRGFWWFKNFVIDSSIELNMMEIRGYFIFFFCWAEFAEVFPSNTGTENLYRACMKNVL